MPEWSPPTQVRWLTDVEWSIVRGVFWDTLPYRQRIFLTDAAGENGRAFAIPTSVIRARWARPSVEPFWVRLGRR